MLDHAVLEMAAPNAVLKLQLLLQRENKLKFIESLERNRIDKKEILRTNTTLNQQKRRELERLVEYLEKRIKATQTQCINLTNRIHLL